MSIEKFIGLIEAEFPEIEIGLLTPSIDFKEVIPMNSLNAILIMAMVKVEYGKAIDVKDLLQCNTIKEVYEQYIL